MNSPFYLFSLFMKRYFINILIIFIFSLLLLWCVLIICDIIYYEFIFDITPYTLKNTSFSTCDINHLETEKAPKCIFSPFIDLFDKNSSQRYFPSYFIVPVFNTTALSANDESKLIETICHGNYVALNYYYDKWVSLLNDLNEIVTNVNRQM